MDDSILKPCPFREFLNENEDGSPALKRLIVCEAAGGHILGSEDQAGQIEPVCNHCDIPDAIAYPHACLYLIPFRIFEKDGVQSYYGCRWYMCINPRNVPKDNIWCRGCRDWFPRPPEYMVPRRILKTYEAIELFLNPPKSELTYSLRPIEHASWRRRVLDQMLWFFSCGRL